MRAINNNAPTSLSPSPDWLAAEDDLLNLENED